MNKIFFLMVILFLLIISCTTPLNLKATLEIRDINGNVISNGGTWNHSSNSIDQFVIKNDGNLILVISTRINNPNGPLGDLYGLENATFKLNPDDSYTYIITFAVPHGTGIIEFSSNDKDNPDYTINY